MTDVNSLLLDARDPSGHWVGSLSSSALSTATAVTALSLYNRETAHHSESVSECIHAGLAWLANHVNADGGWGDTDRSFSNLSTTTLVWAAFGAAPGGDATWPRTVSGAESWLNKNVGGIEPDRLANAVIRRYGKDRTFSVPILTLTALSGRLGSGKAAWARVIPLPFELAALPRGFFAALRLPVVSYALPALIAIGLVRHRMAPSGKPWVRWIRSRVESRTLKVLESVQPENGGFLEATPLTSFVTMSLIGAGHRGHPVTERGIRFLMKSVRPDGSWPIDTNLATWVTTLSVNALAAHRPNPLDAAARERIADWLIRQQYTSVHPYTGAKPGGWAWTPLPGGVPDADDTAGAVLALRHLEPDSRRARQAACMGIRWLIDLQNSDGGIPTFCRGWGHLSFDRSSPDLTAHALRAWRAWYEVLDAPLQRNTRSAITAAIRYLRKSQRADGSWFPLWFGNQHAPDDVNPTYGTSRVLAALAGFADTDTQQGIDANPMIDAGVSWLMSARNQDGGWGGDHRTPSSLEETALVVEALALLDASGKHSSRDQEQPLQTVIENGLRWLHEAIGRGEHRRATPIGFYFARLWYFESLYPLTFTAGAVNRANARGTETANRRGAGS